jgi:hypothetical protein
MSNVRRQNVPWSICQRLEHRSNSFQSGPVGQREHTNAAKGVGLHDHRNYTSELRGNFGRNKTSKPPSPWLFTFASGSQSALGNEAAGWCSKTLCASGSWSAGIACCPSAAAAPEWLQMQCRVIPSRIVRRLPPNPSIEGMPKRLRLSVTPHVKR